MGYTIKHITVVGALEKEKWTLCQFDFNSTVELLGVEAIVEAENFEGCFISNEALTGGDYGLGDVLWFSGFIPYIDKPVYQIIQTVKPPSTRKTEAFLSLYQQALEDFELDAGDLSVEIFEVQYWNKFKENPKEIWNSLIQKFERDLGRIKDYREESSKWTND